MQTSFWKKKVHFEENQIRRMISQLFSSFLVSSFIDINFERRFSKLFCSVLSLARFSLLLTSSYTLHNVVNHLTAGLIPLKIPNFGTQILNKTDTKLIKNDTYKNGQKSNNNV